MTLFACQWQRWLVIWSALRGRKGTLVECPLRKIIKVYQRIKMDQDSLGKKEIGLIWSLWHLTPLPSNASLRALLSHPASWDMIAWYCMTAWHFHTACVSTACCNMRPQTCAASAAAASAWMHQSWKGFLSTCLRGLRFASYCYPTILEWWGGRKLGGKQSESRTINNLKM